MSGFYKCKCGLCFRFDCYSEHYFNHGQWGDSYGKESLCCPFDKQDTCEYGKEFAKNGHRHRFQNCEGYEIPKTEYDYQHSRERIDQDYSEESERKIQAKFGGYCPAIIKDGRGGYTIRRDDVSCLGCWNETCVVTKQKRDLTKVRIMAELERNFVDEVGLYRQEHKGVSIMRVTDIIPMELAERCLKMKDSVLLSMFETNKCSNTRQQLGFETPAKVRRFYIEKSNAKRDLLQDLALIAEGYTVEHEADVIKAKQEKKRQARIKRVAAKERKKEMGSKREQPKAVQQSLFDG